MFLNFFFALRGAGFEVSSIEWLTLLKALKLGLHKNTLQDFYHLSKCLLVRDESGFDDFDRVFAQTFGQGEGWRFDADVEGADKWLEELFDVYRLSESDLANLRGLGLEELLAELLDRIENQKEAHHGGHHWIGDGGTSPFGIKGSHPTGISFSEEGHGGKAALLAHPRKYENLRKDVALDTRQMGVALKKLRDLRQTSNEEILDLDATIDKTSQNCGDIELVFARQRENQVRLVLAMDTGGSMEPHRELCQRLFGAANGINHWKEFTPCFFHNCVYDSLFTDIEKDQRLKVDDLVKDTRNRRLVIVSDAAMAPYELMIPNGTLDGIRTSLVKGIDRLRQLANAFEKRVWLNPLPESRWSHHQTVGTIQKFFPMYPLTVTGLEEAVKYLRN